MSEKVKVDIISWIKNGLIGPVAVGQDKETVSQLLSPPLGWANSETMDEIDDFMRADIWGYGIWTFYFEGNALDAVTCSVAQLGEHGWHFAIDKADSDLLGDSARVKAFLDRSEIPYRHIDEGFYKLVNPETGENITRRKRLGVKTILAGTDFKTRILFDAEDDRIRVIAYPFNVEGQVISNKRFRVGKGYILA